MKLFNKFSTFNSQLSICKGFTLIELLIVIAVLGVLSAGVLVAIDPVDKINAANDSNVQTDIATIANAAAAYAVSHNGFYADGPLAEAMVTLVAQGELKLAIAARTGYTYTYSSLPDDACTAGVTCTNVIVTSTLRAKKYTATPFQRYESSTGKTCQVATAATACP